jgi:hypothetical protein
LLRALRSKSRIVFADQPSPVETIASKSGHLVVCEEGNELSQVIAANYAFALGAGMHLIPEVKKEKAEALLEDLYSVYDQRETSQTDAMDLIKQRLRDFCGLLPVPDGGSITFVTGDLPFGFGFPEVPSTHLFKYPDLGIAVVNGLAAEQPTASGLSVAVMVDPEATEASEIDAAVRLLPPRGTFVRGYRGPAANVTSVTEMMELFPYDLLLIATHCGDVPGYRWTYEFLDSEGIERTLVVDIALGVGHTDDDNLLSVTQYMRFVSLDGVDWRDHERKKQLYVGTAMWDFHDRLGSEDDELQPVKKETVPRVLGSAALKMFDNNLIVLPRSLAGEGTPIIINNACVSWHELSARLTFSNARACRDPNPGKRSRGSGRNHGGIG